jgi:hypothetical protein
VILTICLSVFLLIAVLGLAYGGMWSNRDYPGISIYIATAVWSLIALWRTFRLGVVVDSRGLHARNLGRGETTPWPAISAITCEIYDTRLGVPVYAPVVRKVLGEANEEQDGTPVTAMGSYRKSVAEGRTQLLISQMAEARR